MRKSNATSLLRPMAISGSVCPSHFPEKRESRRAHIASVDLTNQKAVIAPFRVRPLSYGRISPESTLLKPRVNVCS
jgi:hypothetical protein